MFPRSWTRFFAEGAFWQVFWTYAATPLGGIIGIALGVMEHLPLMVAFTAGCFCFAMSGLGLLSFYQLRFRRSPQHKVSFQRVIVSRPDGDKDRLILGMAFKNLADFPIEVTLTAMREKCAARVPRNPREVPHTIVADPLNDFYFASGEISVSGVADDPMIAELDVGIEYGRPGGKKYPASYSHGFQIPIDITKGFISYVRRAPGEQPMKQITSG